MQIHKHRGYSREFSLAGPSFSPTPHIHASPPNHPSAYSNPKQFDITTKPPRAFSLLFHVEKYLHSTGSTARECSPTKPTGNTHAGIHRSCWPSYSSSCFFTTLLAHVHVYIDLQKTHCYSNDYPITLPIRLPIFRHAPLPPLLSMYGWLCGYTDDRARHIQSNRIILPANFFIFYVVRAANQLFLSIEAEYEKSSFQEPDEKILFDRPSIIIQSRSP